MMKKILKFAFLTILMTSCSGGAKQNETAPETDGDYPFFYETYCNEQHNYCVDYPDFLIPQGEATNRDGQKFLSDDGVNQMMVFFEYKMDDWGNYMDIKQAYYHDRDITESLKNEFHDNYYILSYKKNNKLFRHLSVEAYDAFITVILEFDNNERELLENVLKHVSGSLNIATSEIENEILTMLMNFLHDCWWEKNFNSLLRDNNKNLTQYIDKELGVHRIHSPGTIPVLSGTDDNYGFTDYDNFNFTAVHGGDFIFDSLDEKINPCDLDNPTAVYYQINSKLPHVVIDRETLESMQFESPWPDAEIASLYVFNENNSPRVFYFAIVPDKRFYLVLFDDSLCGA